MIRSFNVKLYRETGSELLCNVCNKKFLFLGRHSTARYVSGIPFYGGKIRCICEPCYKSTTSVATKFSDTLQFIVVQSCIVGIVLFIFYLFIYWLEDKGIVGDKGIHPDSGS